MSKNKNKNRNGSISLNNNLNNSTTLPVENSEVVEDSSINTPVNKEQQSLPFDYREKNIANVIAVLAAFFFVLGVGYFAYKYFINSNFGLSDNNKPNQITDKAAFTVRDSEDMEQDSYSPQNDEQGDYPVNKAKIAKEANKANKTEAEFRLPTPNNIEKGQNLVWTANNYNKGDINKGNYHVRDGDTLWEIAEAVYGDGSLWVNILAANADNIGFLANGQQALIYTGQTITIP